MRKEKRTESVQLEGTDALEVYRVHVWEGSIEIHHFLLLRHTVKRSPADSWAQSSLRNAELNKEYTPKIKGENGQHSPLSKAKACVTPARLIGERW